jgi:hypothetical protein
MVSYYNIFPARDSTEHAQPGRAKAIRQTCRVADIGIRADQQKLADCGRSRQTAAIIQIGRSMQTAAELADAAEEIQFGRR